MKKQSNLNLFLNQVNLNHYTNNYIFSVRETEHSTKTKNKNLSNLNLSLTTRRPFSTSLRKKVKKHNLFINNKKSLVSFGVPKIFFSNKSFSESTKNSNNIHTENYFHKRKKDSNWKNLDELLIFERTYSPHINLYQKSKPKIDNMKTIPNSKYAKNIYLTEAKVIVPSNNGKKKEEEKKFYNDYSKNMEADILNIFLKDKSSINSTKNRKLKYIEKIIDTKKNKLNLQKDKLKDLMETTMKIKYKQFELSSKKELCRRLKEKDKYQYEYINDRIDSLEKYRELNKKVFDNKVNEYLKYLLYQKANEKNILEHLRVQMSTLKGDIYKLTTKISKLEIEKNTIIKWVLFQIQLKERKIILPPYYKIILENFNLIETYFENISSAETKNLSKTIIITQSKDKIKRQFKHFKSSRLKREKTNKILNNEIIPFLKGNEGKEVFLKLKEYKNKIIYKTPEELEKRITDLKVNDLNLLYEIGSNQVEIFDLEHLFKDIKIKSDEKYESFKSNLQNITNDLSELKESNKNLNDLIDMIYFIKINKEKKDEKNKNLELNKAKLMKKVNKIYILCQSVKFAEESHYKQLNEKKKLLKNNPIIYVFAFIEHVFNYLRINIFNFKRTYPNGKKIVGKIIADIDREHRIEKSRQSQMDLRNKYINIEKRLIQKNNKILFLPYRKLDIRNEDLFDKNIKIPKKEIKEKPKFVEFLDS